MAKRAAKNAVQKPQGRPAKDPPARPPLRPAGVLFDPLPCGLVLQRQMPFAILPFLPDLLLLFVLLLLRQELLLLLPADPLVLCTHHDRHRHQCEHHQQGLPIEHVRKVRLHATGRRSVTFA